MKQMFYTYNGSVSDFLLASKEGQSYESFYNECIVFIGEGEAVYTHGQYFGSLGELANMKYFSKITVDGTPAEASGKDSTLAFISANPALLNLDVDTTGITIGLTETFITKVDTNTLDIIDITSQIEEMLAAHSSLADRVQAVEDLLSDGGGDSVAGQIASALEAAKQYTDDSISPVEERVTGTEEAISEIKGDYLTSTDKEDLESAIEEAKTEVITTILDGVDTDFDTLKEVAEWILSDSTGAAGMQLAIQQHGEAIDSINESIENINQDIEQLQSDLEEEKNRSVEKDNELSLALTDLQDSIATEHELIGNYTVNDKPISSNPTLVAGDIQTVEHEDLESAVNQLFYFWTWGEA